MTKYSSDREIMAMALVGLEMQRKKVLEAIANLHTELESRSARRKRTNSKPVPSTPATHLSAEARQRIAAAQRKRWRKMKRRMAEVAAATSNATTKRRKASGGKTKRHAVPHQRRKTRKARNNPLPPSNPAAENSVSPTQIVTAITAHDIQGGREAVVGE